MPDLVSTKRTGINIAAQWIQHFVLVAVNLFLVGYAIAKVGDENYGGWTVIVSIIGYTTLLAPGISVALQHYVAAHATRSDKLGLGRTLSSAYVIYGAAAVVALPICLMISRAYPMIFPKVPALAAAECSDALVWVGAGMVLVILNLPVEGVLLGLQKHYYRSITESVSVLVRAAVVVATFAWFGPSLAYLGAAFFGGACSRVVLSLFFLHKVEPGLRFRPALISKTSLRQIMSYAGHSTIWTICTVLIRESGPIITVWMLGSREATYYYVGARLIFSFGGLIASAGSVFVPVTSSLWASRDLVRLRSVLIRGARFSALLSIPGAACAVLFGQAVLRHWVGPGFDTAFSVLVAIAIGRLATWSFVVPEAMLMGSRALWTVTTIQCIRLVGCIGLAVALGRVWGSPGVAAGMGLPLLITTGVWIPMYASRRVGTDLGTFYAKVLPLPIGLGALLAGLAWVVQWLRPPDRVWILVLEVLLVVAVFGMLSLKFGLDPATRKLFLDKARGTPRTAGRGSPSPEPSRPVSGDSLANGPKKRSRVGAI